LEEAKKTLSEYGGIISLFWCGEESCGKTIEEEVHVDMLGIKEEVKEEKCAHCARSAKYITLLAKTY